MNNAQVYVAVNMDTGNTEIIGFLTRGRGSSLPTGATWIADGWWSRQPSDVNIIEELSRTHKTGPQPVGWRVIALLDIPVDRTYRDALTDVSGKLTHDLDKAKNIHITKVRQFSKLQQDELNKDWIKASSKKSKPELDAVEDKIKVLSDTVVAKELEVAAAKNIDELKLVVLPQVIPAAKKV